tara:strand:+ start:67 stop:435 length:369 start_codon:yes stop_codon:yes gene_type:complete
MVYQNNLVQRVEEVSELIGPYLTAEHFRNGDMKYRFKTNLDALGVWISGVKVRQFIGDLESNAKAYAHLIKKDTPRAARDAQCVAKMMLGLLYGGIEELVERAIEREEELRLRELEGMSSNY